jgi:type I restriction enzyme S subunit
MEVKPGYKQTEVGVIPGEWAVVTATEACELVVDCKNRTPPVVAESDYAVVRTPNVRDGQFVLEELRFTDEDSYRVWTARAVPQFGDIMITREPPLGEVCAVPADRKVCLGQRMMLYRPSPTRTSSTYLLYSLMSQPVRANLFEKIGGSTVGHAKVDDIRFLQLPLPSLPEQRAIAEALSDVDKLLGGLDRLITKKRDLKQATMQQLLTGQTRLPGFHSEWTVKTLFELAERKKELFDDGDWIESEHITTEGIRLIQTGNIGVGSFIEKDVKKYIFEKSFTSLRCKQLRQGDLLVCRLADPAGRACLLPDIGEERIVTSVDVTIFRPPPEMADRLFLSNVFSTPEWFRAVSDRSGGTTHKRVSRGALGRLPIKLPPLPEQTAIAEVLTDMDAELAELEQRREKTRALKQAMMQELLTGKARLI